MMTIFRIRSIYSLLQIQPSESEAVLYVDNNTISIVYEKERIFF